MVTFNWRRDIAWPITAVSICRRKVRHLLWPSKHCIIVIQSNSANLDKSSSFEREYCQVLWCSNGLLRVGA